MRPSPKTINRLHMVVKDGLPDWKKFHPDKGPCGAVAMALWLCGFADSIAWCETRHEDESEWESHWVAISFGEIVDVAPIFSQPRYRFPKGRQELMWPDDYSTADVYFWYRTFKTVKRT